MLLPFWSFWVARRPASTIARVSASAWPSESLQARTKLSRCSSPIWYHRAWNASRLRSLCNSRKVLVLGRAGRQGADMLEEGWLAPEHLLQAPDLKFRRGGGRCQRLRTCPCMDLVEHILGQGVAACVAEEGVKG